MGSLGSVLHGVDLSGNRFMVGRQRKSELWEDVTSELLYSMGLLIKNKLS